MASGGNIDSALCHVADGLMLRGCAGRSRPSKAYVREIASRPGSDAQKPVGRGMSCKRGIKISRAHISPDQRMPLFHDGARHISREHHSSTGIDSNCKITSPTNPLREPPPRTILATIRVPHK